MSKERVTITLREDQFEQIEEMAADDDPRYSSKSEVVRHLIDRVGELEDDVEELQMEIDRLQNEKQVLIEQHQQTEELAVYKEEEQFIEDASFGDRVRWFLFGRD